MWTQGQRPRVRQLLVTLTAAALPLAYYVILRQADVSWQLAQESGHREWPFWMIVVSLAPLALPAALAYARRPAGFLDAAIRLWPFGAVVVFFIAQTPHASGACMPGSASRSRSRYSRCRGFRRCRAARRCPRG